MPLLRTFGELRLELGGADAPEPDLRSVKPLVLLAYLVLEGQRPVERAFLADLLWGDERPDTARASFRQALHTLRRAIGADSFSGDRGTAVSLVPGKVESDLQAVERAFGAEDLRTFLQWYRGPFLVDVDLDRLETLARWTERVRQRWRDRLLLLARSSFDTLLARGALAEAAELAREVLRVEPEMDEMVPVVADALVAAGAEHDARDALERARDRLAVQDLQVPSDILTRLARLDRARALRPRDGTTAVGEARFDERFVGRDDALGRLFRLAERARAGRRARALIMGPPGIGKSRLLDEFEMRLGGRGLRVARIRYLSPMRSIAWSALGECIRTLCALPGAIGVSERTAGVLVGLLPELGTQYPSAKAATVSETRLHDARADALEDLLDAVADDRVMVLLQDDTQWVDDASRATIDHVLGREGRRVLDVRATRDEDAPIPPGTEPILLGALSASEIRLLLGGLAPAGTAVSPDAVAEALGTSTAGIPQLLMLELHRLVQEDQLYLDAGRWVLRNEGQAQVEVGARAGLIRRLDNLSHPEVLALRTLVLWRRPIEDGELHTVLQVLDAGRTAADWRRALSTLEQAGFIVLRRNAWVVAHELVVEAVQRASPRAETVAVLLALGVGALAEGPRSVQSIEHLALLCGQLDAPEVAEMLVRRGSRDATLRLLGLRGQALVERVVAATGRPEWRPRLTRALGFVGRRTEREQISLGALGTLVVAGVGWLLLMLQPRLVVEAAPMVEPSSEEGGVGFVVQPRIGVLDGFGRRLETFDGVVRVRVRDAVVASDSVRRVSNGRAQFKSLLIRGHTGESLVLRFSSHWWVRGVEVDPLGVTAYAGDAFRIVEATVNDRAVAPNGRVRVPADAKELHVVVTYEFTAEKATANYVVGAAANWLPAPVATVRLAGLPRPVRNAWQTVAFTVPAPPAGDGHAILFAMDAEGSVEHVFSRTNWSAGAPEWGDGNDLVSMPQAVIDSLRARGRVLWGPLLYESYPTPLGRLDPLSRAPARPVERRRYVPWPVVGGAIRIRTD